MHPPRHKAHQGGWQSWGSSGKLYHLAGSGARSPKLQLHAVSCSSGRQMDFSLVGRAFLMGETGHAGRLLGIWKAKWWSKTKLYRRAIAGRIIFQRSFHGDRPLLR